AVGLNEIILKRFAIGRQKPAFAPLHLIRLDPCIVESDLVDCADESFAVGHGEGGGSHNVSPGNPLYTPATLVHAIHRPASAITANEVEDRLRRLAESGRKRHKRNRKSISHRCFPYVPRGHSDYSHVGGRVRQMTLSHICAIPVISSATRTHFPQR